MMLSFGRIERERGKKRGGGEAVFFPTNGFNFAEGATIHNVYSIKLCYQMNMELFSTANRMYV